MATGLDQFRLKVLRHIVKSKSLSGAWPAWEPAVREVLGDKPSGKQVFELGDALSEIFRTNKVEGRTNKAVSNAGNAWERLLCWYFNLVCWGSNVVAILPTKEFRPPVIGEALTVILGNTSTNSESDIILFSIPETELHRASTCKGIDAVIRENPHEVGLSVVQCKTTWNDNAQIPMLWDLIYNADGFRKPGVKVGTEGMNPQAFRQFRYAFVTVPTTSELPTEKSLAVLRVRGLSGGNYWGRPSGENVARSVKELVVHHFESSFTPGGVAHVLDERVASSPAVLDAFTTLDFEGLTA